MIVKRYSFPSEQIAKELIDTLNLNGKSYSNKVRCIVCLGFQDKYLYNEATQENELISKGLTYDVDIKWYELPNDNFNEYEVNPITPNHNFL